MENDFELDERQKAQLNERSVSILFIYAVFSYKKSTQELLNDQYRKMSALRCCA